MVLESILDDQRFDILHKYTHAGISMFLNITSNFN